MKRLFLLASLLLTFAGCQKDKSTLDIDTTTYKITFDANGGTGIMKPQEIRAGKQEKLNINQFYKIGYDFSYWNTKFNNNGISYQDGDDIEITEDVTLYAQWRTESTTIKMCNGSKRMNQGTLYDFYDSGGKYGSYDNNEYYKYSFIAPVGKCVVISFSVFNTEEQYDYLTINGVDYSGSTNPGTIFSTGSTMIIEFHSDSGTRAYGWEATVSIYEPITQISMCNGTSFINTGITIDFYDSGGYSSDYSDNENYTHKFLASAGKRIKFVFNSFVTYDSYDYLYINDVYYSGTNSPGTIYSSDNSIIIRWHSNYHNTTYGWSASVTAID